MITIRPNVVMLFFTLFWIFTVILFIMQVDSNARENEMKRELKKDQRTQLKVPTQIEKEHTKKPKHHDDIYISFGGSSETHYLWPDPKSKHHDDRILAQMKHIPRHLKDEHGIKDQSRNLEGIKAIYAPQGIPRGVKSGMDIFKECPVDMCSLTKDHQYAETAHARLLQNEKYDYGKSTKYLMKPPGQIWILWLLESPRYSQGQDYHNLNGLINWTATYRPDSTIVTPYEKFVEFKNSSRSGLWRPPINYAEGKTKKVAWFVSNCKAKSQRLEYARQLAEHIQVDIYGGCGSKKCSHKDTKLCEEILKTEYKFYLAFENSNCEYYITEKLFWNALLNNIVPVVMGARKEDYLAAAPPGSYIHVEDFSGPQHLAKYLYQLDENDFMYSKYFRWKTTGEFINTKFWCRLCSMLHDVGHDGKVTWYKDIETWWRNTGSCTVDRWDNPKDLITNWEVLKYMDVRLYKTLYGLLSALLYIVILSLICYCICKVFCILWRENTF